MSHLAKPYLPVPVRAMDLAFPADVERLIPDYDTARAEATPEWEDFAQYWFYPSPSPGVRFYPREGIDPEEAYRHLSCVLRTFSIKHEHKIAAMAVLCAAWFWTIFDGERAWGDPEAIATIRAQEGDMGPGSSSVP